MHQTGMPAVERMYGAVQRRDASFDGRLFVAVRTTRIFCRPSCPARTPLPRNVEYFPSTRDAVLAGYRPCLRCRPLASEDAPHWLDSLLAEVESRAPARWRDRDLASLGLEPDSIRTWFVRHHEMTFHAYARTRNVRAAFSGAGFEDLFGPPGPRPAVVAALLPTPLGALVAAATEDGICLLEFVDRPMLRTQIGRLRRRFRTGIRKSRNRWIDRLADELERYFAGSLRAFTVPVVAPGSPFQEAVWVALRSVPYGERRTYGDLATAVDRPTAVRAVGRANGDNRISIVIPCHRIVGSDGGLRGYGGGLWRKELLLALEAGDDFRDHPRSG